MKTKNGYTLVEVLVTCAIFTMVIGAVYAVYAKGLGYSRTLSGQVSTFRIPAVAFDKIYRELLCDAHDIIIPEPSGSLKDPTSTYIVFTTFDDEVTALKIVGYFFDSVNSRIIRAELPTDTPDGEFHDEEKLMKLVSESKKVQVVATDIKSMEYMFYNNLVYVSVTAGTEEKPYSFKTSVYIR